MKEGSEINPRKELGLGLLPWDDHVKAIQAKAALSYLDGSRGLWKEVLDEWILEKHAPYGRGAILMDIPDKTSKMKAGSTPLPAFWKEAIKTLDSLPLEVIDKDAITRAQARAEPIWHSHHYDLGEKAKLKAVGRGPRNDLHRRPAERGQALVEKQTRTLDSEEGQPQQGIQG